MNIVYNYIRVFFCFWLSIGFTANALAGSGSALDAHVHGAAELTLAIDGENLVIDMVSPTVNFVGFERRAVSKADRLALQKASFALKQHQGLFVFNDGDCKLITSTVEISGMTDQQDHQAEQHHHDHDAKHDVHQESHHADQKHNHAHDADHDDHQESHHAKQQHNHSEQHDADHDAKHHADDAEHDAHDDHQGSHHAKQQDHHAEQEHNHSEQHDAEHDAKHHADDAEHDDHPENHSDVFANYHFQCASIAKLSEIKVDVFNTFSAVEKINAMWITENQQASAVLRVNNNVIRLR